MGGGQSSEEYKAAAERSKKLEAINRNQHKQDKRKIKLLLLGAGESGKSTVFKQLDVLYGANFPEAERQTHLVSVHSGILSNARELLNACDKLGHPLKDSSIKTAFMSIPEAEETLVSADENYPVILKRLWADPGAQATWALRSELQIQDSLSWYMENLDRIAQKDYVPSVDDILRARVRTSGIVERTYVIEGIEFCLYDVGGQRNERKKWIHLFDAVTSVIFVAAVNEYDQVLYEDENMKRMDETLMLFHEVCNAKHFSNSSIILFLNKSDLFRSKLARVPLRIASGPKARYEDFAGPYVKIGDPVDGVEGSAAYEAAYEAATAYFLSLFQRQKENPDREMYSHITCATDTSNIRIVFSACKETVLKSHLRGSGFLE